MNGITVSWKHIPLLRPDADWHARIVTAESETVMSWDFVAGQLDAAATFADTCQALSFDTANNGHFFTPPDALPNGTYLLQLIDAATPAVTDQPIGKLFRWHVTDRVVWVGDL
ncbi:MAG: hypothetical protein DRP56_02075 [Planctomycetota bacterium]|nr:MAG: hypothetical protein DRP56_02075 [Planctomycetota bacterium]